MIPLSVAMWDHVRDVGRYDSRPCEVVETDWPYDCDAKRLNPEDVVFQCRTHSVWWHRRREALLVLDFEEFSARIGAPTVLEDHGGFRFPNGISKAERRRQERRIRERMELVTAGVAHARHMYDWLVSTGDVRPPTHRERLERTAAGHDDNPAVQAARRVLRRMEEEGR
jgi:hypothetical protein